MSKKMDRRSSSNRLFRSVSFGAKHKGKRNTTAVPVTEEEKIESLLEHNTQLLEEKTMTSDLCNNLQDEVTRLTGKIEELMQENDKLRTKQTVDESIADPEDQFVHISIDSLYKIAEAKSLEDLKRASGKSVEDKMKEESRVRTASQLSRSGSREMRIGESKSQQCVDCKSLQKTLKKALVEAMASRIYSHELAQQLAQGEDDRVKMWNRTERKLVNAVVEKEMAVKELEELTKEKDVIVQERDRSLEEWGNAASKWESALDQLDQLMTEMNKVKEERNRKVAEMEQDIINFHAGQEEKANALKKMSEECNNLREQLTVCRKERKDSMLELDSVLKANYDIGQELRRVTSELTNLQQKHGEQESNVETLNQQLSNYKQEREHAVVQWKTSVKERKKLHREINSVTRARDDAIQKCFSVTAQVDKLKEEKHRLQIQLDNIMKRDGEGIIDDSLPCALQDCKFCNTTEQTPASEDPKLRDWEEMNVSVEKVDKNFGVTLGRAYCDGVRCIMVLDVKKNITETKNVRKYDQVLTLNGVNVEDAEEKVVKKCIEESGSTLTMVIRRAKRPVSVGLDVELKAPKKSKNGFGFNCGIYVKSLSEDGAAQESAMLETGDYIEQINGKNVNKVLNEAMDKFTKRAGDTLKIHISREAPPLNPVLEKPLVIRRSRGASRRFNLNRISVISNESSSSFASFNSAGASSIESSSIMSLDSHPCGTPSSESIDSHSATPFFAMDRPRLNTVKTSSPLDLGSPVSCSNQNLSEGSPISPVPEAEEEGTAIPNGEQVSGIISGGCSHKGSQFLSQESLRSDHSFAATSIESPRVIRIEKKSSEPLGLEVCGGNRVGIYVKEVLEDGVAHQAGIREGDRLLKVNSYDLSWVILDYATRVLDILNSCCYFRIEVQNYHDYKEILKNTPLDSLLIKTKCRFTARSPDELSYTMGETLNIINTRANFDPVARTWKWVAIRIKNEGTELEEGLVPCMESCVKNILNDQQRTTSPVRESESDAESVNGDIGNRYGSLRRHASGRRSWLRKNKKLKKRESNSSLDADINSDASSADRMSLYEILSENPD